MECELAVAREIQMGCLPRRMPELPGYDLAGASRPADATGGDMYDVVPLGDGRAMLLLADATGHGVGPALSATQVRAMLRIAARLGAGLEATLRNINDQLDQDLASNRLVTAFLGVLDSGAHQLTYHSAGQGPLLHFHAATGDCEWRKSTTLPLGLVSPLPARPAARFDLDPGDVVALITDGVFEYEDGAGRPFGEAGVAQIVRAHHDLPMQELLERVLHGVERFAGKARQADDITVVLVRRLPAIERRA
jgi:phosphoserine phosphatase